MALRGDIRLKMWVTWIHKFTRHPELTSHALCIYKYLCNNDIFWSLWVNQIHEKDKVDKDHSNLARQAAKKSCTAVSYLKKFFRETMDPHFEGR
jgi:hypothetical protein